MALESKAAFSERVQAFGLSTHAPRLAALGWGAYGELAFATSFVPGTSDDDKFVTDVGVPLLEKTADEVRVDPLLPKVRRLFYEAYALAAADLKRRVEGTSSDGPRKVMPAEREERRAATAGRLKGIRLTGELDISNHLLDRAITMYEENVLRCIPLAECTKRGTELVGVQKDPLFALDSSKRLQLAFQEHREEADTSSEIKLQFALRRRGLALDMADILDFDLHDAMVDCLFKALLAEPPPGYARVSVHQLINADQQFFRLLAEKTRAGIRRTPDGRPCDIVARPSEPGALLVDHPDFRMALQPFAQGSAGKGPRSSQDGVSARPDRPARSRSRNRRGKRAHEKVKELRVALAAKGQPGHRAKGGGKGEKGKAERGIPQALQGKCLQTPQGKRICFRFNLEGCDAAPPGAECPKGIHLCVEPGCLQPHPLPQHR